MKNLHFCPECKESIACIGVHWDQWKTEFIKAHTGHKGYPSSTPSEKEEVESQHKFWKDRNPPQCLHCGKTEQELAKESTTNLQKIDNQLVDTPTKVDKENTIDSDIDFTSKSPMFKALEKAFMNSYCQHQKKNNEACSDCGRMILKAK